MSKPTLEQLTAKFTQLVAERVSVSVVPSEATSLPNVTASAPPQSIVATPHAMKGYDLDVTLAPDQVVAAARLLDARGFGLDAITGVDWLAQNAMEIVYDYFHPTEPLRVVVHARVPRSEPDVPTISEIFPGANWHEREAHDFFGLRFTGHPNLKPFLLPEDANFHPLRKDYAP